MIKNQAITTTAKDNDCMEEHHLNNERNEHKLIVNVSPPNENRWFLKRAYTSPKILSRSVPRRNKSFIRYRINRSLSFDNTKNEYMFKSPNSSSGSSSFENDKQLTRSAKIMRALNFNCSPFYNQRKKIKKTLNFNLTPSPKKFPNHKSPRDGTNLSVATSSPKINKTLNFDTSPSNSSTSSILLTSFESMDENQNQTPSQRNTKAKKILNYVTPKKRMYISSPDMDTSSPSLRLSLKEKIDGIVRMSSSPARSSFNKSRKLLNVSTRCNTSTPRNLYADFSDEDNERPCTPENTFSIVPESMSAIKKGHKKERSLRQIDNLSTKQANALTDSFMVEEFDDLQTEKRPLTPPMTEKSIISICDPNSIKQSHKKDKSKKKIRIFNSDDEFSDTGSIFDYSIEQGNAKDEKHTCYSDVNLDKSENSLLHYERDNNNVSEHSIDCSEIINNSNEIKNNEVANNIISFDAKNNYSFEDRVSNTVSQNTLSNINNADENTKTRPVTPNTCERNSLSIGVTTPENRIHFLQRIQTESIKKSHKKVKDENKKKLFLPKSLDHKLEVEKLSANNQISLDKNCLDTQNTGRASTPENVNSSRLLLSNFSSVKKSHKKDKHNKIVSQFMRRQKYLNRDVDYNIVQHEVQNESKKKCQQEVINKPFGSNSSISNLYTVDMTHDKISPSKRKIFSNLLDDDLSYLLCDSASILDECESTEEFKIFTPIKRRRPLLRTNLKSNCLHDLQLDQNESAEEEIINIDASRCTTPTLRHIGCAALSEDKDNKDANNEKINSVAAQERSDAQDQNGRSTPTNMSTLELLPNINSIKKSHKKDKRGNGLHRGLILEQEKLFLEKSHHENLQNDYRTSIMFPKLSDNKLSLLDSDIVITNKLSCTRTEAQSSPIAILKSSQDFNQGIDVENRKNMQANDSTSSSKTPPNCLLAKSYIRLLQTTSIKKSHKKDRDRKRHKLVSQYYDSELSDDASIFGNNEKIDSLEDLNIQKSSNETDIGGPDCMNIK